MLSMVIKRHGKYTEFAMWVMISDLVWIFFRIDQPGIETINQSNYNGIKPFLGLEVSEITLQSTLS